MFNTFLQGGGRKSFTGLFADTADKNTLNHRSSVNQNLQ